MYSRVSQDCETIKGSSAVTSDIPPPVTPSSMEVDAKHAQQVADQAATPNVSAMHTHANKKRRIMPTLVAPASSESIITSDASTAFASANAAAEERLNRIERLIDLTESKENTVTPSSADTAELPTAARLALILQDAEYIGETDEDQREAMNQHELQHRNYEIQSELQWIDSQYGEVLEQKPADWQTLCTAFDEAADRLAAEQDEIEAMLEEVHGIRGGGRYIDAEITEARQTAQALVSTHLTALPRVDELKNDDIIKSAPTSIRPPNGRNANGTTAAASLTVDDRMLAASKSKSERAVLARLAIAGDEIAERRKQRAAEAKDGLLNKVNDYIEKYIEAQVLAEVEASDDEDASTTQRRRGYFQAPRTSYYPYHLGTVVTSLHQLKEQKYAEDSVDVDLKFIDASDSENDTALHQYANVTALVYRRDVNDGQELEMKEDIADERHGLMGLIQGQSCFADPSVAKQPHNHLLCAIAMLAAMGILKLHATVQHATSRNVTVHIECWLHGFVFDKVLFRSEASRDAFETIIREFRLDHADEPPNGVLSSSSSPSSSCEPVVVHLDGQQSAVTKQLHLERVKPSDEDAEYLSDGGEAIDMAQDNEAYTLLEDAEQSLIGDESVPAGLTTPRAGKRRQQQQRDQLTPMTPASPSTAASRSQVDAHDKQEQRWRRQDLESLFDSIQPRHWSEAVEQQQQIVTPMMTFQKRAVAWLNSRETHKKPVPNPLYKPLYLPSVGGAHDLDDDADEHPPVAYYNICTGQVLAEQPELLNDCQGGILADEMGLGKSLETIALIVTHPFEPQPFDVLYDPVQRDTFNEQRQTAAQNKLQQSQLHSDMIVSDILPDDEAFRKNPDTHNWGNDQIRCGLMGLRKVDLETSFLRCNNASKCKLKHVCVICRHSVKVNIKRPGEGHHLDCYASKTEPPSVVHEICNKWNRLNRKTGQPATIQKRFPHSKVPQWNQYCDVKTCKMVHACSECHMLEYARGHEGCPYAVTADNDSTQVTMRGAMLSSYHHALSTVSGTAKMQRPKQRQHFLFKRNELNNLNVDELRQLAQTHNVGVLPEANKGDLIVELRKVHTWVDVPVIKFPKLIVTVHDEHSDSKQDVAMSIETVDSTDDEVDGSDTDSAPDVNQLKSDTSDAAESSKADSDAALAAVLDPSRPRIKATLIVSPMSIVYQWQSELTKHAPELKVLIYDGMKPINADGSTPRSPHKTATGWNESARDNIPSLAELSEYDVVLTTYSVLADEVNYSHATSYSFRQAKRYEVPISPLLEAHWHRLVLDEAQRVQNAVGNSAKMANRLLSTYRWCVSGTPIGRHGLSDLWGLLVFLQVEPYAESRSLWSLAMDVSKSDGFERLQHMLRRVMWRHSKQQVINEISLPPISSETIFLPFNAVEYQYYRKLEDDITRTVFNKERTGTLRDVDASSQLEVLRQACVHPQIASTSSALLGKQLLPMTEIAARLIRQAEDEKNASERELCRTLNSIALYQLSQGDPQKAEDYLREVWKISDVGIDAARSSDALTKKEQAKEAAAQAAADKAQQSSARKRKPAAARSSNDSSDAVASSDNMNEEKERSDFNVEVSIITENSQARQWRLVELVTTYHLIALLESKLASNSVAESERQATQDSVAKLKEQHETCLTELIEIYDVKITDVQDLLVRYEQEIIPGFLPLVTKEVQHIYAERTCLTPEVFHADAERMKAVKALKEDYDQRKQLYLDVTHIFETMWHLETLEEMRKSRSNHKLVALKNAMHIELRQRWHMDDASDITRANSARLDVMIDKNIRRSTLAIKKLQKSVEEGGIHVEYNAATPGKQSKRQAASSTAPVVDSRRTTFQHYDDLYHAAENSSKALLIIPEVKYQIEALERLKAARIRQREQYIKDCQLPSESTDSSSSSNNAEPHPSELIAIALTDTPTKQQAAASYEHLKTRAQQLRVESLRKQRHVMYLQAKFHASAQQPAGTTADECSICAHPLTQPVVTACGHIFDAMCITPWVQRKSACALCRHPLTIADIAQVKQDLQKSKEPRATVVRSADTSSKSSESSSLFAPVTSWCNLPMEGAGEYGTKIEAIVQYIMYLCQQAPTTKSLVFTQFHRMLDFMADALKRNGIKYIQLKGNPRARAKAIDQFQNDPSINVLLMSLRQDNSGLTLVSATHVFLMEPSLNRSVEQQAINRVHRIGQRSNAYVHKFIMDESIEQRIEQTINNTMSGGKSSYTEDQLDTATSSSGLQRNNSDGGLAVQQREELNVVQFLGYLGLTDSSDTGSSGLFGDRSVADTMFDT